jgi:hypothetical protein
MSEASPQSNVTAPDRAFLYTAGICDGLQMRLLRIEQRAPVAVCTLLGVAGNLVLRSAWQR